MASTYQELISKGERLFVSHCVDQRCRMDGRDYLDYREIELEAGVLPASHGSARVRVGRTDAMISVKAEMMRPTDEEPDRGQIKFFADISANASPIFEGRGGDDMAQELSDVLYNAIVPNVDRRELCIWPGRAAWTLHIDILVLEFSTRTSLVDAAGFGVKAALLDTKLPKLTANQETEEIDMNEDPHDLIGLNLSGVPLLLTLTRLSGQYIVDATAEEEASAVSSVIVAFDQEGEMVYSLKIGCGTLYPEPLKDILPEIRRMVIGLHENLRKRVEQGPKRLK